MTNTAMVGLGNVRFGLYVISAGVVLLCGNVVQIQGASQPVFLVSATVTNILQSTSERNAGLSMSHCRIDHVYYGDKEVTNTSFVAYVYPIPKVNEVGIWALKRCDVGNSPIRHDVFGRMWPCRKTVDPRFQEVLVLAQTIESLSTELAENKRKEFLIACVTNDVSEVSAWSIREIGARYPEELDKTLLDEGELRRELTVAGRLVADEVLTERKGMLWTSSSSRYRDLRKTGRERMSWYEEVMTNMRFNSITTDKATDKVKWYNVLRETVDDTNVVSQVRELSLRLLGRYLDGSERSEVFELLVQTIKDECGAMRTVAAATLGHAKELSKEEVERIREVCKSRTEPALRKLVKELDERMRKGREDVQKGVTDGGPRGRE